MSRIISLLSGKGGSGKTTLALSFASMLSDCKIRTLLVDCDLSTNGATYFFEDQMTDDGYHTTFFDIALHKGDMLFRPYVVNEYFDFLPALGNLRQVDALSSYERYAKSEFISEYFREIQNTYDVILLDCQAGYTNLLDFIIPFSNYNLVIMEADAISSAAIRNLYLKVANLMDGSKFFQIFNKVTPDEYKIYSKVTGGTFFTNIGTITFDWSIRNAFSLAQIPNLRNTKSDYGIQIYEICKSIFVGAKYQERLATFSLNYSIEKIDIEVQELKRELAKQETKLAPNKIFRNLSAIVSMLAGCIGVAGMIFLFSDQLHDTFTSQTVYTLLVSLFATIVASVLFSLITSFISIWQDKKMLHSQWKMYQEQETGLYKRREELAHELDLIKRKASTVQSDSF